MALHRTRSGTWGTPGLRQVAVASLGAAAVLFFLPAALLPGPPLYQPAAEPASLSAVPLIPHQEAEPLPDKDRGRAVRLKMENGTVEELTMAEYLWGVVAAEMPAAFEPEALKAQACAARTYTVARQEGTSSKHPEADICTDSSCCQAYVERGAAETRWGLSAEEYAAKVEEAVSATDGLGILYEGKPIQALFFSSAPGKTVDAVEVWGNAVDYLKSVDSPEGEEVPNYRTQVVLSAQQVKQAVLASYPGADLTGDPAGWFGEGTRNQGGTVSSIPVGGVTLTGGQVRGLFSLRSAAFTVAWDGNDFTFSVTGYGHGVGMSQYGANAMAKEGKNFEDILTWYYTGAQVGELW